MLIIRILNVTASDDLTLCDYDVDVSVTTSPTTLKEIAKGRIEGHVRGEGWRRLAHRIADELPTTEAHIANSR